MRLEADPRAPLVVVVVAHGGDTSAAQRKETLLWK